MDYQWLFFSFFWLGFWGVFCQSGWWKRGNGDRVGVYLRGFVLNWVKGNAYTLREYWYNLFLFDPYFKAYELPHCPLIPNLINFPIYILQSFNFLISSIREHQIPETHHHHISTASGLAKYLCYSPLINCFQYQPWSPVNISIFFSLYIPTNILFIHIMWCQLIGYYDLICCITLLM